MNNKITVVSLCKWWLIFNSFTKRYYFYYDIAFLCSHDFIVQSGYLLYIMNKHKISSHTGSCSDKGNLIKLWTFSVIKYSVSLISNSILTEKKNRFALFISVVWNHLHVSNKQIDTKIMLVNHTIINNYIWKCFLKELNKNFNEYLDWVAPLIFLTQLH